MKQIIDHLSQSALQEYVKIIMATRPKKPRLFTPKTAYFHQGGLDKLAHDLLAELFQNPPVLHIIYRKGTQDYELKPLPPNEVEITLKENIDSQTHIQAYIICRAIIHLQITTSLPDISFHHDATEKLINSLLIKYGLGIFVLNASEELHDFGLELTSSSSVAISKKQSSMDSAVHAFCRHHRISTCSLSPFLLPAAAKRFCSEPTHLKPKTYVYEYAQRNERKNIIRRIKHSVLVLAVVAIIVILYSGIIVFSQDKSLEKKEIQTSKADLITCISELEKMIETVNTQDIYTLRSIASKRNNCESLRLTYNQLIIEYTQKSER